MKLTKKALAITLSLGVLFSAAMLGGCGGNEKKEAAKPAAEKVLRVGTNATYVPFEFMEEKNGKKDYAGFDMDMAREIGKRIDMKVEIHNIPFAGLIPAMLSGELDMLSTGMVITEERAKKVDFVPYYETGLGILLNKNVNDVKTLADLKGKRIGVQMATTGSEVAHKIEGVGKISEFDHNADAFLELKNGGVDAVIAAMALGKYFINTTPDSNAKLVAEPLNKQTLGFAVNKNNKELLKKVEKAVADIKADGTYDKLITKWKLN